MKNIHVPWKKKKQEARSNPAELQAGVAHKHISASNLKELARVYEKEKEKRERERAKAPSRRPSRA